MRARIPLDVDLEDRLVYGLTPTRLAYIVVAVLAALAVWSSHWLIAPARGCVAAVLVLLGAALSWGRWRGRAADGWMMDFALFLISTRRIKLDPARVQKRPCDEEPAA